MCGLPVTEQFASVSKSANLPPTHVASKHQRDLLGRTSNAATGGSTSVQMAIIVSLHKITKEPPGVSGDAKLAAEWLVGVLEAVAATRQ
jgi:hypothetical protein